MLDEMTIAPIRTPLKRNLPKDIIDLLERPNIMSRYDKINIPINILDSKVVHLHIADIKKNFSVVQDIKKSYPVSFKLWAIARDPCNLILEWAINNNIELFFTYRKDLRAQMYSYMWVAVKKKFYDQKRKENKLNMHPYAESVNIKGGKRVEFAPISFDTTLIASMCVQLLASIAISRLLYASYSKYGTAICYEDVVEKRDFSKIGVTPEMFEEYNNNEFSLRPSTPYVFEERISNFKEVSECINEYIPSAIQIFE